MDCIDKFVQKQNNSRTEDIIFKLLKDKAKTKNLRDKMILETFDNLYSTHSATSSYQRTAIKFNMSIENVRYIVRNRCLIE